MDRIILHCDLNSFFASVECLYNPDLKNVPMAVAGNKKSRHGIILAKNELAKKYNVKTAEAIWQAKQKCPELTLVAPHYEKYWHFSQIINDIYQNYTDLVEPFGIDESWLDVTGSTKLFGDGLCIAQKISNEVKQKTGLTLSIGVSFNKIFAKLGSDYKKPDAITVIPKDGFEKIVYPLPVSDLLFVGNSSYKKLNMLGIRTIGDLARSNKEVLSKILGKQGEMIWNYANGLDDSPVLPFNEKRQEKSIGNSITFTRDLCTEEDIKSGLTIICDEVGERLRFKKLKCTGVQLGIKDENLKTVTRREKISTPTNLSRDLYRHAVRIFEKTRPYHLPVRLLSVTGTGLVDENSFVQENMFDALSENNEKFKSMEKSIDTIRSRFGRSAIKYGSSVGNNIINQNTSNEEYDEN